MAELVDAPDLGSGIFDVRVRVSPFAPITSPWPCHGSMKNPATHAGFFVAGAARTRHRNWLTSVSDLRIIRATFGKGALFKDVPRALRSSVIVSHRS